MRPQRLPAFGYIGCYRYFVTCCTWKRRLLFDASSVSIVRSAAHGALSDRGFEVLAWVFMPDHTHWLLQGTCEDACLKSAMMLGRQRSAIAYRQLAEAKLWQEGYHERVLRKDEETAVIANYILTNPVRAGLVKEPQDYPWSWSVTLST